MLRIYVRFQRRRFFVRFMEDFVNIARSLYIMISGQIFRPGSVRFSLIWSEPQDPTSNSLIQVVIYVRACACKIREKSNKIIMKISVSDLT